MLPAGETVAFDTGLITEYLTTGCDGMMDGLANLVLSPGQMWSAMDMHSIRGGVAVSVSGTQMSRWNTNMDVDGPSVCRRYRVLVV